MFYIVDNFDSFTFNLVQYIGSQNVAFEVFRNNERTTEEIIAAKPTGIILSPGPCGPNKSGICPDLTLATAKVKLPLMGVCLGHQVIGNAFGANIIQSEKIVHGKTSQIFHSGTGLLANLPSPFLATRYHSLIIDRSSLPDCLMVNGWTQDGLIMSIEHKTLPIYGVQFHPESIASEYGIEIIKKFLDFAKAYQNDP